MSLEFPQQEPPPKAYINLQLSLNGYYIATTVVLGGLLRGDTHMRESIVSELSGIFSPPTFGFREYLLKAIIDELKRDIDAEITDEFIFSQVVPFYSETWDTKPSRRSVRGHLANTAQALELIPTSDQVDQAINIIKDTVEREKKDGLAERVYRSLIKSQRDGK